MNRLLTVLVAAKNAADYAEVFLRSAARNGLKKDDPIELCFCVGRSNDGTESMFEQFGRCLPVPTTIFYEKDATIDFAQQLAAAEAANDGLFNEGIWDVLIKNDLNPQRYYSGLHIDIEFLGHGLWHYLIDLIERQNVSVAGLFDPGEMVEINGQNYLSLPRFFPMAIVANWRESLRFNICWTRPSQELRTSDRILYDNGALALNAGLRSSKGIGLLNWNSLSRFVHHFGYVWTNALPNTEHEAEGQGSRLQVSERLKFWRNLSTNG